MEKNGNSQLSNDLIWVNKERFFHSLFLLAFAVFSGYFLCSALMQDGTHRVKWAELNWSTTVRRKMTQEKRKTFQFLRKWFRSKDIQDASERNKQQNGSMSCCEKKLFWPMFELILKDFLLSPRHRQQSCQFRARHISMAGGVTWILDYPHEGLGNLLVDRLMMTKWANEWH